MHANYFIHLNRNIFESIYRLNMKGEFKGSFSTRQYNNDNLSNKIINASKALKSATISAGDYSFINPEKGDFVYFDCPYHQSGEKFYTQLPFDENEQTRLRDFAKDLTRSGVNVILSNSDTKFVRSIYKDFNISTIDSHYSSRDKNRKAEELVIRNY